MREWATPSVWGQFILERPFWTWAPAPDGSVDVAISNGVINLCTDKRWAFQEIFRILKPAGRLLLADIVVHRPVPDAAKANVDLWTA